MKTLPVFDDHALRMLLFQAAIIPTGLAVA